MRWTVLWCVTGLVLACGKSERRSLAGASGGAGGTRGGAEAGSGATSGASHGSNAGSGGTATNGGTASSGAAQSTSNGGVVTNGGMVSAGTANGGVVTNGGSATNGGATSGGGPLGGTSGQPSDTAGDGTGGDSDASDGGAAGAAPLACAGEYTACGCGCCGGSTSVATCYYPEHGDSLSAITRADRSVAADPSCENAGCAAGQRYLCCTSGGVDPTATYLVNGFSQQDEHVWIARQSGERCTWFEMHGNWFGTGAAPPFPLTIPDGWFFERVFDGACQADSRNNPPVREVIGGLGSLKSSDPNHCALDADFTLFFRADDGTVDAVRFAAKGVPLPPAPACK